MKQRAYTIALLAAALLAACQQEEEYQPQPERNTEVITFSTPSYARSAQLRYGAFEQGDQVGVLGYCLSENNGQDYSDQPWDAKKVFAKPDVFYNTPLTYNNGMWGYSWDAPDNRNDPWYGYSPVGDLHPWHDNENYTYAFFAYYPYAAGTPNSDDERQITIGGVNMGTVKLTGENATGDPTITYEMTQHNTVASTTSSKHWWEVPDFMLSYVTDHRKADGSVRMNFRHLLCAFEFEINNYNPFPVTLEDLQIKGGTVSNRQIHTGFYRSLSVTGQQSDYTVNENNLYVGAFQLVGATSGEDEHILQALECPAATYTEEEDGVKIVTAPSTTPIEYDSKPIALLFIPDANGKLTSDGNASLCIDLRVTNDDEDVNIHVDDRTMNLENTDFQPGVRNIFSINIVGNDFYLQMRSDGTWEDDGDSDIVFE